MNFKEKAEKLEKFLEDEFKKSIPLLVLADKSVVYGNYKIKQSKQGTWNLRYLKTDDLIDTFRTKTSAILAAKFYDKNRLGRYNDVKNLDLAFWNNSKDSAFFEERMKTTKDLERRDLFLCRFELTRDRAAKYKDELSRMFKANF
jgi:hypothetical protein